MMERDAALTLGARVLAAGGLSAGLVAALAAPGSALLTGGGALAAGAGFGLLVLRDRRRAALADESEAQLTRALNRLAARDLAAHVPEGGAVQRELARALNDAVAAVAATVNDMRDSVESGTQAGDALARLSSQAGASLDSVGTQSGRLSRGHQDLAATVDALSARAAALVEHHNEAAQAVGAARAHLREAGPANDQLQERAEDAMERSKRLGECAADLVSAVDEFKGLFEHLKIIAVNARIETIQQGAEGRRFSAVAAELSDIANHVDEVSRSIVSKGRATDDAAQDQLAGMEAVLELSRAVERGVRSAVSAQSSVDGAIVRWGATGRDVAEKGRAAADSARSLIDAAGTVGQESRKLNQLVSEGDGKAREIAALLARIGAGLRDFRAAHSVYTVAADDWPDTMPGTAVRTAS